MYTVFYSDLFKIEEVYQLDPETKQLIDIDPNTGQQIINPDEMPQVIDPNTVQQVVDPNIDPNTGQPIADPNALPPMDPVTGEEATSTIAPLKKYLYYEKLKEIKYYLQSSNLPSEDLLYMIDIVLTFFDVFQNEQLNNVLQYILLELNNLQEISQKEEVKNNGVIKKLKDINRISSKSSI